MSRGPGSTAGEAVDPAPTDEQPPPTDSGSKEYHDPPMSLWDHLAELRKRLVISIIAMAVMAGVAWEFREYLLTFLVTPFAEAWRTQNLPGEVKLHFQSPAAAFLGYFKLSLLGGAAAASPIIFYQLWAFIAPGLYAREKKFVIPFVLCSSTLFVGGGYFGWRMVFPLAFKYLLGLSGTLEVVNVQLAPTVMLGDYINFVTRMLLGFGLIFEIPLIIFFLSVAGIVNYLHLIHYGRWFVVGSFIIAAMITPPDITSQVFMALPMVFLYGGSILLAYAFGQPPTENQRKLFKERKARRKRQREIDRERRKAEKEAKRQQGKK